MSLAITIAIYDDFKKVLDILPKKFLMFLHEVPGSGLLRAWAVSDDLQEIVELTSNDNTAGDLKSTFVTDFPDAIEFTSLIQTPQGNAAIGPPIFSSVLTKEAV